jgi:hypothetical protein
MNTDTPRTDEVAWPETGLVEGDFARQLERELTAARRLAEKYRNLSCDSQDEADETLLPWETTNQNEL